MEILKNVLVTIYIIVCIALILITTFQAKDSEKSADDTYENPRANKYFEQNKSRTKAGKIQRRTIIVSSLFAVLTVATTFVCYIAG